MSSCPIRRALIAVYDKTGIVDFARALVEEFGVEIISTGGTAKHLKDAGIPVTLVEEVTGFPELLDGRVKTLHPKIHAGILADRDNPEHMRQLREHGIEPIDMVVVNLYPFEKTIRDPNCRFEDAIEMIDIGGPCMLRAAAKNHRHVLVVENNLKYPNVVESLTNKSLDRKERLMYAARAFGVMRAYETRVLNYLLWQYSKGGEEGAAEAETDLATIDVMINMKRESLRYGENPHQRAAIYDHETLPNATQWHDDWQNAAGMSYNNYVDAHAALALCSELTRAKRALWHRLIAGDGRAAPSQSANMKPIRGELISRRNLPHIQREGVTYFITFRLRRGELSAEERDIVMECCLHPDGKKACLHAVVAMPDHVHLILTPLDAPGGGSYSLGDILHGVKGVSARRISDRRHASGPIWQDESFDRVIRNAKEFEEKLHYVCENPVTAGLEGASTYEWSICESHPGWSEETSSAGVDLAHKLICYFPVETARDWNRLLAGSTAHTCVFIKHTNACGVGIADDPIEAYRRAYLGQPNAAMGGILAVDFNVDDAFADVVMSTLQRFKADAEASGCANPPQAFFAEVIVAPSFDEKAVEIIRTRKPWGERVRLLTVGDMSLPSLPTDYDYKRIAGGMLIQTPDLLGLNESDWRVATERAPTEQEMADLRLAWLVCKHTKSNAITLCKDGMLIGNGAGQMSRVMSCRIATWLAKENGHADKLAGSVAGSDAFFPFRDGPDILIGAGVTAIIQPGGSKRDDEVIAAANECGIAMILTGTRHFKH